MAKSCLGENGRALLLVHLEGRRDDQKISRHGKNLTLNPWHHNDSICVNVMLQSYMAKFSEIFDDKSATNPFRNSCQCLTLVNQLSLSIFHRPRSSARHCWTIRKEMHWDLLRRLRFGKIWGWVTIQSVLWVSPSYGKLWKILKIETLTHVGISKGLTFWPIPISSFPPFSTQVLRWSQAAENLAIQCPTSQLPQWVRSETVRHHFWPPSKAASVIDGSNWCQFHLLICSFVIICLFIPHVSVRICNPRICFLKLVEEKNGRITYTYKYVQYTCHKKNDTSTCVQREQFSLMAKQKKHEPMEQWLSQDMSAMPKPVE